MGVQQLYINAQAPANPRNQHYLGQAIVAYQAMYTGASNKYLWHGITVVSLLQRAMRDGIVLPHTTSAEPIATAILRRIEQREGDGKADAWDCATAVEACIALAKPDEALRWTARYVRRPYTDAFELASTLRQFTEVWQLNMQGAIGIVICSIWERMLLQYKQLINWRYSNLSCLRPSLR